MTTFSGALAGSKVGVWVTHDVVWGGIYGSTWGLLAGFWGSSLFFVGHEVILFSKIVENQKMIHLLKEVNSVPGKQIQKIKSKLEKQKKFFSTLQIQKKIQELDHQGRLCDGSLTGHPHSKRLRKKIVSLKKLIRMI